ncbi:MAG: hypothetical protein OEV73_00490 [Desulfobulbaceae bacterium]|nr:hypothetical protein [Desulfobulbaceae bacterium]
MVHRQDHHLALAVYHRCSDDMQYAEGMPVGIAGTAISNAMTECGVVKADRLSIYDLVKLIGRTIAGEVADDHKRKMEEARDAASQP